MRNVFSALICILFFSFLSVKSERLSDSITSTRPRVIVDESAFTRMNEKLVSDTLLQKYAKDLLERAEGVVNLPLPEYNMSEEGSLLSVSRDVLDRIMTLGVAYKINGDHRFRDNMECVLRAVCGFKDWHYYHFLDVAEMATAVAIGYDWLYDEWSPEFRNEIKETLIRNAIVPGLAVYGFSPWQYWLDVEYNWNQVCNGGLAIASIAIADTDPEYADIILPKAIDYYPAAMESYGPDGAWGEGVSYWFYASRYTGYFLGTLLASLGSDYGILGTPGFSETGYFPIHMTTPSGGYFSYADIDMNKRAIPMPVMFWLADKFGNPDFAEYEHLILENYPATALDVLYYYPPQDIYSNTPLDASFGGIGKYVVMRENWDRDKYGLYVAVSGGDNRMNHGHLDKGSFELECDGIKWIRDLGSDKYNLPGYWEKEEGGERWNYFRLNTHGHSTPVVNGKNQLVDADTYFIDIRKDDDTSYAVIDLSEAYADVINKITREFSLNRNDRVVVVKDEYLSDEKTKDIQWQVITEAEITGSDRCLKLTQDGKEMYMTLLSPKGGFTIESAQRNLPEAENPGFKKICVRIDNPDDLETIEVAFSPNNKITTE